MRIVESTFYEFGVFQLVAFGHLYFHAVASCRRRAEAFVPPGVLAVLDCAGVGRGGFVVGFSCAPRCYDPARGTGDYRREGARRAGGGGGERGAACVRGISDHIAQFAYSARVSVAHLFI